MKQNEAIEKYYANKYVWLDAFEHDYDEVNAEIPNDMEDNKLFDTLYSTIIKPIEKTLEEYNYHFCAFERGEDINRLRLYFGYPVSDCMESIDSTQDIIDHLKKLDKEHRLQD